MAINQEISTQVLAHFVSQPSRCQSSKLGEGLINQTWLICDGRDKFVLQRLNRHVFAEPVAVINNSIEISRYLLSIKSSYKLHVSQPRKTISGQYFIALNGCYWRAMSYIEDTLALSTIDDIKQARSSAYAYGHFCAVLSALSPSEIAVVIPQFHDINLRLAQLSQAINQAPALRLARAKILIDKCVGQRTLVDEINAMLPKLPLRITHNDTKINNLLFDTEQINPKAIIDLDTCMPGYLMHDFGDLVRTCCSSLVEDEPNIAKMQFKPAIFQALLSGYTSAFGEHLSAIERSSLLIGAKLMPLMVGVRFLTDYLQGDKYFSIHYAAQNLDRANNQLQLYRLIVDYLDNN